LLLAFVEDYVGFADGRLRVLVDSRLLRNDPGQLVAGGATKIGHLDGLAAYWLQVQLRLCPLERGIAFADHVALILLVARKARVFGGAYAEARMGGRG
jgi:hypothetical protein